MYRLVCAGLFSLLGFLSITICMDAKENYSSVSKLKIPNFNEIGHLDWELHAATVSPQGNDLFLTTDPILYLYSDQLIETTAKSERGVFSLRLGQAYGDGIFNVEGNGFTATGKDWIWNNSTKRGENQISFRQRSVVRFKEGLGSFFAMDTKKHKFSCDSEINNEKKNDSNKSLKLTVAEADYLEFLSIEENSHRFLLDGNVSIEGINLFLTCEKMEVLFNKDENASSSPVGKISMIYATGDIILKQDGRTSYSNTMTLDLREGTAYLRGNARVVDDEWGEAVGETIILEKGKRMAKVLGGKNGRPKLELPPLPDLGFRTHPKNTKAK